MDRTSAHGPPLTDAAVDLQPTQAPTATQPPNAIDKEALRHRRYAFTAAIAVYIALACGAFYLCGGNPTGTFVAWIVLLVVSSIPVIRSQR